MRVVAHVVVDPTIKEGPNEEFLLYFNGQKKQTKLVSNWEW